MHTMWLKEKGNELEEIIKEIEVTPQTNADRIRSMSDEELAEFLTSIEKDTKNYCTWGSVPCCLLWLTSEVKR